MHRLVCMLSQFSSVRLFVTLWTGACQAPLTMDSTGKNTGVGVMPSSRDFPDPEIELASLMSPELAGRFFISSHLRNPIYR